MQEGFIYLYHFFFGSTGFPGIGLATGLPAGGGTGLPVGGTGLPATGLPAGGGTGLPAAGFGGDWGATLPAGGGTDFPAGGGTGLPGVVAGLGALVAASLAAWPAGGGVVLAACPAGGAWPAGVVAGVYSAAFFFWCYLPKSKTSSFGKTLPTTPIATVFPPSLKVNLEPSLKDKG